MAPLKIGTRGADGVENFHPQSEQQRGGHEAELTQCTHASSRASVNSAQSRAGLGPEDSLCSCSTETSMTTPASPQAVARAATDAVLLPAPTAQRHDPPNTVPEGSAASAASPRTPPPRKYPSPDGRLPFGSPSNVLSPMSEHLLRRKKAALPLARGTRTSFTFRYANGGGSRGHGVRHPMRDEEDAQGDAQQQSQAPLAQGEGQQPPVPCPEQKQEGQSPHN